MTLQEHYNSIVGGKGNKAQFLKQARHLFPQHITNLLDFDTTVNVLKSKQIISENTIGGVVSKGFNIIDWKKVLAEETKAVEKNVSKEVEDYRKNAYNNADMKNADNVNFNEIMKGFYLELKNPKNHDKTVDELKDIVVKNLAKDALHYTKDGMFGVEGVGFTDEAPSLKQPVEPKGKHKSSGYGDLDVDVEKVKANVKDTLSNSEAKTSMPKKVKEMPVTPQNSAGVKKMKTPGAEKRIKLKEGGIRMFPDPIGYDKNAKSQIEQARDILTDAGLSQEEINAFISDNMFKKGRLSDKAKEYINNLPLDLEIWNSLSDEEKDDLIKNNSHDPDPHYGKSWSSLPDDISANIARDEKFIKKKDELKNPSSSKTESKVRSLIAKLIKEELKKSSSEWRLPTIEEFKNILYPNKHKIKNIADVFLDKHNNYWSSSDLPYREAWSFSFNDGKASVDDKDWPGSFSYVRAVRDVSSNSTNSSNSTIIGNLEVMNNDLKSRSLQYKMDWDEAIEVVKKLNQKTDNE